MVAGWLWVFASSVAFAGDPAVGQALYAACAPCHGDLGQGSAASNAPLIGGQYGSYLERQLLAFKEGKRGYSPDDTFGTQMSAVAQILEPAEISDLVSYITTLKPPPGDPMPGGDAAKGEANYSVCSACHGVDGGGDPSISSPMLVNQHGWYLERQMAHFRGGVRVGTPGNAMAEQMPAMAQMLDEAATKDVVAYIVSIRKAPAP